MNELEVVSAFWLSNSDGVEIKAQELNDGVSVNSLFQLIVRVDGEYEDVIDITMEAYDGLYISRLLGKKYRGLSL